ncbi:hypothetical protein DAPPUDRAFT_241421 [Daphnia pulex]|uniref:Uncharacterized protein n=1 Tax=Daphnia pulex TaxID=6669 RepID=E9GE81_DAPPU|nr:hypothetical protein DAPPUDRAFT_241421 [Daphnia pulex]|eukprot:EFX82361.1 hypothetical protein DAPPUDRAFT_241421 [Daphnia pulex]
MAPLNDKEMKKWRAVAGLNVILGSIVLIVQVATLFTLYEWVDWIGIGIWGGCFMISAGSLTIQRNPRLISMSVCAMLSGLALIIFYAWNLGVYNNYSSYYGLITTGPEAYCYYYGDWRLAADIIFIVCGCLAMMINLVLSMNAKAIVVIRPIVRYPVNHVNAYPMSTTNTTYVVTSSQHPTAYYPTANQQTVYQVPVVTYPSNNTNNGVIYQTTSPAGYPPMNNNQQQQQPVYYTQTNPPTYATTAY